MSTKLKLAGQGRILKGSAEVTVSALADGASETLTISDSEVKLGDVASVDMEAVYEAGLAVECVKIPADGSIEVVIRNNSGGALTGSTADVQYCVVSDRKSED